jgi:hypothetical protein
LLSVLRDRIPHYGGKANFINPFLQINFTDWSFSHAHRMHTHSALRIFNLKQPAYQRASAFFSGGFILL